MNKTVIINKYQPFGFCFGVDQAIKKAISIIKSNQHKKIIFIGHLVHNELIIKKLLSQKNVSIINDNTIKDDIIAKLPIAKNNEIIIFSAHGTNDSAIALAIKKKYQVFNLVCCYVQKNFTLIKQLINKYDYIYFFGNKSHPEAISAKMINPQKVIIFNQKKDIKKNLLGKKILVVCQTTTDYTRLRNSIKWFNQPVKLICTICPVCLLKQNNLFAFLKKNNDAINIVISSTKSSNGINLYHKIKTASKKTFIFSPKIEGYQIPKFTSKKFNIFTSSSIDKMQADRIIRLIKSKN